MTKQDKENLIEMLDVNEKELQGSSLPYEHYRHISLVNAVLKRVLEEMPIEQEIPAANFKALPGCNCEECVSYYSTKATDVKP